MLVTRCSRVVRSLSLLAVLTIPHLAMAIPPGFEQETILSGLTEPIHLTELPDGRMLILEKQGKILIFDPARKPVQTTIYLTINDLDVAGERGLTSLVLDPDFEQNGYIYVYYARASTEKNRISRFTHLGDFADPMSEVFIWQDNEKWLKCCHHGGGLDFGPAGKLYLTIGEGFRKEKSQDLSRAGGKIIRINKDGTIPSDNPFVDGSGGNLDEIWAYGLRNPFRANWDDVTDRFFFGDVGSNDPLTAREEINVGRAGGNFGWPDCEGSCDIAGITDPLYDYAHAGPKFRGGSITAGFVYWGNLFPSQYTGAFFFADYSLAWIRYLRFNPDGSVASVNDFASGVGAPVHLIEASDGSLYYVDIGGNVQRIVYRSDNQAPTINSVTATPPSGNAPLTVDLTVSAVDPEGDPLSYHWWFSDGTTATGASPGHTYTENGLREVYVQVSDGNRATLSVPIQVQIGNPPTVAIDLPEPNLLFRAGDTIAFSATASDPDEKIAADNYVWGIQVFDDVHALPGPQRYTGESGTFQVDTSDHDRYRLTLTVTDSDGLKGFDEITIHADTTDVTVVTDPPGIPVMLGSTQHAAPFTETAIIGSRRTLTVPESYCFVGQRYHFSGWSDGGAAAHQITVKEIGETWTATFTTEGVCNSPSTAGLVVHLEADAGVSVKGDRVKGWADQSGLGNDLTASGDPQLMGGVLNGRPVIDFDGKGDKLERTASLNRLPARNADRTVYLVANYRSTGYGGFSYGTGTGPPFTCNWSFGTVVDHSGALTVQGWCDDFSACKQGTDAGWLIQSAVLQSGTLRHYQDDELIDTRTHDFDTVLTNMVVGAELDSRPFIDMQVAAILVYDRALSATEQAQTSTYLRDKYFPPGNGDKRGPAANDDAESVPRGGSVTFGVLANDVADGTLEASAVVIVSDPGNGELSLSETDGSLTYTHDGSLTTGDRFAYQVADSGGKVSNVATVCISITGTSFKDVQSIFTSRCAVCHDESRAPDLRKGNARSSIVGVASGQLPTVKLITPGFPGKSYLWHKVNGSQLSIGGSGQQMPITGGHLSASELKVIKSWIEAGAPVIESGDPASSVPWYRRLWW